MDHPPCLVMPELHRKVVVVNGQDARAFLHALLTTDIKILPDRQCRPTALCNPGGRVLATFFIWTIDSVFYLITAAELAETIQKTLLFYRLRSKADIQIASSRCLGIDGKESGAFLTRQGMAPLPDPMEVTERNGLTIVNLKDRYLLVGEYFEALKAAAVIVKEVTIGKADQWDRLDTIAGWPNIGLATQGRFVAQQINLDLLDAVDFKKGCFPGQEVIARLQYPAKQEKRMRLYHQKADHPPQPGALVFCGENSLGEIVSAQPSPEGGVDMLVVLPFDGTDFDGLSTRAGGPIDRLVLPYPIDDVLTDRIL